MKKIVVSLLVAGLSFVSPVAFSDEFGFSAEEESVRTHPGGCSTNVQNFEYDVVGESHRVKNFYLALGDKMDLDFPFGILTANLVAEPSNKFDRYAVKVVVANSHIGYVPQKYSKTMSLLLKKKKATNIPVCIYPDRTNSGFQAALNMDPYLKSVKTSIKSWRDDEQISK